MNKKSHKRKSNAGIFVLLIAVVLLASLLSILAIGTLYESYGNNNYNYRESSLVTKFNGGIYRDYVYCPLTEGVDTDEDGVFDLCDNCMNYYNPEQRDDDLDRIGNACEHLFAGRGESQGDGDDEIPECRDTVDNDGDGFVDYPADPSCTSLEDDSEFPVDYAQCSDTIDNDGDGLIDYPADPECSDYLDNSEGPFNYTECRDTIDNDGDGLVDFPADPGCSDYLDNSEEPFNIPQCRDTVDNDGDGFVDYPADAECSDYLDNDESR